MMIKDTITYFYRNEKVGFSIGKVFKTVSVEVSKNHGIKEIFMPSQYSKPWDVLRNGFYAYKHRNRYGINHITGSEHFLTLFLPSKRTIVSVMDVMYINYLTGIKRFIWKQLYIKTLKYAEKVTFISEESKKTTLEHVSLAEEKMCIIPCPVSSQFSYNFKDFNSDKPIILHIGTLERKNLTRTVEALKGIKCHLRIIGKLDDEILKLLQINKIEFSNGTRLSDEEIVQEYNNCDIVNFVSMHEGFGMPIIEGQASGRIVITSNISPMKDVANDGAILVDPYDIESINKGYLFVIKNENERNDIIKKGLKNAKLFQVSEIARQYLALYESIQSK
jgi:glycosyltransferase involved in cell wall biosynthesis